MLDEAGVVVAIVAGVLIGSDDGRFDISCLGSTDGAVTISLSVHE